MSGSTRLRKSGILPPRPNQPSLRSTADVGKITGRFGRGVSSSHRSGSIPKSFHPKLEQADPPKVLVLKSSSRFRKCKEGRK